MQKGKVTVFNGFYFPVCNFEVMKIFVSLNRVHFFIFVQKSTESNAGSVDRKMLYIRYVQLWVLLLKIGKRHLTFSKTPRRHSIPLKKTNLISIS